MIREEFLHLLRCPISRRPLTLADETLVDRVNRLAAEGRVRTRGGELLERRLDGALVDQEQCWLYPVYDEIPTLMPDAAISLEQLGP